MWSERIPGIAVTPRPNDGALGGPYTNVPDATGAVNPQDVDDLLSREMMQLSFKERSHIQEEIHGVRCLAPVETPELLEAALHQLDFHLNTTIQHKPAYDRARSFPTTYIDDIGFKLKFLRAELLNPLKAAHRLVKFLELVRDIFGEECLQRPVSIEDLGTEGTEALRCGQWQLLPCRDRAG